MDVLTEVDSPALMPEVITDMAAASLVSRSPPSSVMESSLSTKPLMEYVLGLPIWKTMSPASETVRLREPKSDVTDGTMHPRPSGPGVPVFGATHSQR